MSSRERITIFTQVSSDKSNLVPLPEFVFKGKATQIKLNHPKGVGHQRGHICPMQWQSCSLSFEEKVPGTRGTANVWNATKKLLEESLK